MRGGMFLQFRRPSADEFTMDAFQRVVRITQIRSFVLIGRVGISRRRLFVHLLMEFVQMTIDKVRVDRVDRQKSFVTDRTEKDLLPVEICTVALIFGTAVAVAMKFLLDGRRFRFREATRLFHRQVQGNVRLDVGRRR